MDNKYLNEYEEELVESFENNEWLSSDNLEKKREKYSGYAKASQKKDKRSNIRISERDLNELQKRAIYEGLPYQTLISSVLHKFINGSFIENRV